LGSDQRCGVHLVIVGGDATSIVPWGVFRDQEDAQGYFQLMHQVGLRHGIPMAVYSDHHSVFQMTKNKELTLEEQLAGRRRPTQFGRLLEELGVEQILAHSPQAKGRVERLWGTFQDRLTSELRLAGASTRLQAQEVLVDMLPRHNRRFAIPALEPDSGWVPWPADRRMDEYFCFKYQRVVARDNTVRFEGYLLDIHLNPAAAWRALESRSNNDSMAPLRSTASAVSPMLPTSQLRSGHPDHARWTHRSSPGPLTQTIPGGRGSRPAATVQLPPPDKIAELLKTFVK
jgi:hypothetical protein